MARLAVSLSAVFMMVVALGVPARGAVTPPVPPQDFVVGGGDTFGPIQDISIDVRSDPLGGNPSGFVAFVFVFGPAPVSFGGPVACLAVHEDIAVIGIAGTPITVVAVGAFGFFLGATDCSTVPTPGTTPGGVLLLSSGDMVVFDAPSKAQCKDGGWRNFTDVAGEPFTSQGACIAFALGAG
jgi:hypothetical protein